SSRSSTSSKNRAGGAGVGPASARANARPASRNGQKGGAASPQSTQRPNRTVAPRPAATAANSRRSRVFPAPLSPSTTMAGARPPPASSSAAASRASSASRPTKGDGDAAATRHSDPVGGEESRKIKAAATAGTAE